MHIVVQVHHVFCVFQKQLDGRHDNGTVGMLQSVIQDILKTKSIKIPYKYRIAQNKYLKLVSSHLCIYVN